MNYQNLKLNSGLLPSEHPKATGVGPIFSPIAGKMAGNRPPILPLTAVRHDSFRTFKSIFGRFSVSLHARNLSLGRKASATYIITRITTKK